ncbi:MAG TPA: SAM-dependent chlorinase/fluorinase [Candidatus Limnocylindrales bacterium]|nr:SAM-dependent chlorinase/fluorinase [Candidatus Limnocylindrales bacterium]
MAGPLISLLSDFGARDPSAAIMRGVVLGIAPDARIVDISHEVHKYAIRDGALLLWCALPYLPVGYHVAVVDPGVGTSRLPIAIGTARGDVLIGPDNGLLVAAAGRLGGISTVHVLESAAHRLPVISTSFHGRDIFAPAAAHLASGVALADLGRALDPATLVATPIREPLIAPDRLHSSVVYVDTFGNVKLAGLRADLEAALGPVRSGDSLRLRLGSGREVATTWQATFGDVPPGATLVYEDSYGRICVAASQADAARVHGLVDDLEVIVERGNPD